MKKLSVLCSLILLVLLLPIPAPTLRAQEDGAIYAQRGPYPVGTFESHIPDEDRPLDLTVWYPALNPDNLPEQTTYILGPFMIDGQAISMAAPDVTNGPYPLVVFSHASAGTRFQSRFLTEHLASYGFVVIAAEHPGNDLLALRDSQTDFDHNMIASYAQRPLDLLRLMNFAEGLNGGASLLAGAVDTTHVAVTGHSFGGYAALSVGGACLDFDALRTFCQEVNSGTTTWWEGVCHYQDAAATIASLRDLNGVPEGVWPSTTEPRVRAVVALAPWNAPFFGAEGLARMSAPTMVLVGSADGVAVPERDAYAVYNGVSSVQKALVVLQGAGHAVFVDSCSEDASELGLTENCWDPVWNMGEAHVLINHFATAFLLATLNDDVDAAAVLSADVVDFGGVDYATTLP